MSKDHEITFCAQAAGWINEELARRPELPFGQAKIEQSARKSRDRRDITLYSRSGAIALTIEVKLPYTPEGRSPYNDDLVDDALVKAARAGADYFATWNVNRIVLWRTNEQGKALHERQQTELVITRVRDADDLASPAFQDEIRKGISRFLDRAAAAIRGDQPLEYKPLDSYFISLIDAGLESPIRAVQHALEKKYRKGGNFKLDLDRWMRDVQGWHLSDDELIQRDNLERASKFSCYVQVNKAVFYLAMRRRWTKLKRLRVPGTVTKASDLQTTLQAFFKEAMRASRDYQTIFKEDFGDELPYITDDAVPAWRELLDSIEKFDFTKIGHDVIGPIFERLISPEERHRYGQHYTMPEVCDLINVFCIRDSHTAVMDPSCGGGTFLVRAYARKKYLADKEGRAFSHTDALHQLAGVDISSYATHLTTMNLATRDLIDDENYPLVAQSDFFDVRPNQPFCMVPLGAGGEGGQMMAVPVPRLDAMVGNPPYVRQEEISIPPTAEFKGRVKIKAKSLAVIKSEQRAYKKHLLDLCREFDPSIKLSGRSDLHVYFWPHAAKLLKHDAYFGFLTSSGWLDVDYGFRLQEFVLKNYAILAVFESQLEPWFTGARVTTCAALLRRESDPAKREGQLVKFVQLRSMMGEVFPPDQTEEERQASAEALRDRIESLTTDITETHWRVRVVPQRDLWKLGVGNARFASRVHVEVDDDENDEREGEDERHAPGQGPYFGGKWGIWLRAPDIYFKLASAHSEAFVPLSDVAVVKRGVTTGCDKFFFVRDLTAEEISESETPQRFKAKWGILPHQTDRLRIIEDGTGHRHLVEAEFLEPEVHNLMKTNGVTGIRIDPDRLRLKVFLCSKNREDLRGTHALRYIHRGEKEGFHEGSTCAARNDNGKWYDLRPGKRGDMIWAMAHQYRHIAPYNGGRLFVNHNLFDVHAWPGVDARVLCGILNSTLVAMHKHLYGRWAGTEGNLKTEVIDVKMMPIPDPRRSTPELTKRIKAALAALMKRDTRNLTDEFGDPARQELDDAVLELLGIVNAAERQRVRDELYAEMTAMHGAIRAKELKAIENKKRAKRGGAPSAATSAAEIWLSMDPTAIRRIPDDFIDGKADDVEMITLQDGKLKLLCSPLMGGAELRMDGHSVELGDESRAKLAMLAHEYGRRGPIPIPRDSTVCADAVSRIKAYADQMLEEFHQRAADKTASEKLAAKVVSLLQQRLGQYGNPESKHS